MKLIVAQSAGFCFGVRHAVETAEALPTEEGSCRYYMLGELIHNRQVIEGLRQKGIGLAETPEDIPPGAYALIRTHGVSPAIRHRLEERGLHVIDFTCPFVGKSHTIVREALDNDQQVIIAGERNHPEIEGLNGVCEGQAMILSSCEEASDATFPPGAWILVAQTTFSATEYARICDVLRIKIANLKIFDTICNTTESRQKEAAQIASEVDLMLVIGSPGSSNTRKLLDVCSSRCGETILVERPDQAEEVLRGRALQELTVGITAGASTPERIIREVIQVMTEQENRQIPAQNVNPSDPEQAVEAAPEIVSAATDAQEQAVAAAAELANQAEAAAVPSEPVPDQPLPQASSEAAAPADGDPSADSSEGTAPVQADSAATAAPAAEQTSPETTVAAPAAEAPPSAAPVQADAAPPAAPAAEAAPAEKKPRGGRSAESGEMSFSDFIDNIPQIKRGVTVRGTIIRSDNEFVYVDVRDKSEGKIARSEFANDPDFDLDTAVEEHREIDVYVRNIRNTDMGKEILLSKARVDFGKHKALLEEAYNNKTPITVKVANVVKDGVIASFGGIDIYVHRTQLELSMVNDLEPYRGQTLDILVTQFDPERKRLRVSGSRRALLSQERRSKAEEVWAAIEVGKEYKGVVRSLTDFGAFVDIGGVDGLVHVSELSWNRIRHPSEVVSVGDQIHVHVKDFDLERKRISLGYRDRGEDPYYDVENRFPVGSIVRGIVVRMFPFGAFIEIAPGVDALCHVSQISNVRLNKPHDVLAEGMEVDARVLEVSSESRRISVSIKDIMPIDPQVTDHVEHDEAPTSWRDPQPAAENEISRTETTETEKPAETQPAETQPAESAQTELAAEPVEA